MIEVIVSIALMVFVIVPIVGAAAASVSSSSADRSAGQVETALVTAADRVNRAPMTCDYALDAEAAVTSRGWAADRVSVRHSYYVPAPSASPSDPGTWVLDAACEPGSTSPRAGLVQRIAISVTSPDGEVQREIQVIKRDS
ncbi:MAG: hypothetical protein ACRDZZ_10080 [Ilumatobacteraceae bacterium]